MQLQEAAAVPDPRVKPNDRRHFLRTSDGREYVAKNDFCKHSATHHNPMYLVSEVVASEYFEAAGLSVPNRAFLLHNGREYIGSEYLHGRRATSDGDLSALFRVGKNAEKLTRALLLDLALLNSDRTSANILCSEDKALWFIDFEKGLWGDGRIVDGKENGDLYRIDPRNIELKIHDYLGDFLACNAANTLVFDASRWSSVVSAMNSLPLDLKPLEKAERLVPPRWLNTEILQKAKLFLPQWWERLKSFFSGGDACTTFRSLLAKRGRL